jgi:Peptidase A4 family.
MKSENRARIVTWRLWPAVLMAGSILLVRLPAAAASTVDPAAGMPVASCASGDELQLPVSSTVEDDGWIRVNYEIDGVKGYQELPPIGFVPSSATDTILARHHLPVRPAAGSDLAAWTSKVSGLWWNRSRGLCKDPINKYTSYAAYNQIWGGVEVRSQPAYLFRGVEANFRQPQIVNGYCQSQATVSSWVGLGGDTNSLQDFFQTGTGIWANGSIRAWYEAEVNGQYYDAVNWPFTVSPNDSMFAQVSYSSVNFTMYFLEWNDTTNQFADYNMDVSGFLPAIGTIPEVSAEWIDERRSAPLLNYGATHWSAMKVQHSNSYPTWTNAYPEPTKWNISITTNGLGSGGTTESTTSGITSSNTMSNTWKAC